MANVTKNWERYSSENTYSSSKESMRSSRPKGWKSSGQRKSDKFSKRGSYR